MRTSQTRSGDADTPPEPGGAPGVLYRLVHAVTTAAGALGVVILAVYASVAVPHSPPLYLAIWFVGLLALAAVPTVTAAVLDGAVRVSSSPFAGGDSAGPENGSRGAERASVSRGCCDARDRRRPGDDAGCPSAD